MDALTVSPPPLKDSGSDVDEFSSRADDDLYSTRDGLADGRPAGFPAWIPAGA